MMTKPVAIIPARGGSKRLPRKNIRLLRGKPVLAYTIKAAQESGLFGRVIVSTEDSEIAQISHQYGAEVFARDAFLASDKARIVDVCNSVLGQLGVERATPETFCCLLATAALREAKDIVEAYKLLQPGDCNFVMAVTDFSENPFQALRIQSNGTLELMWPDLANTPRWDAPKIVVDNGSTYWCATGAFLNYGDFYGPTLKGYAMPRWKSIDINTDDDWCLLEYFFARHGTPL